MKISIHCIKRYETLLSHSLSIQTPKPENNFTLKFIPKSSYEDVITWHSVLPPTTGSTTTLLQFFGNERSSNLKLHLSKSIETLRNQQISMHVKCVHLLWAQTHLNTPISNIQWKTVFSFLLTLSTEHILLISFDMSYERNFIRKSDHRPHLIWILCSSSVSYVIHR